MSFPKGICVSSQQYTFIQSGYESTVTAKSKTNTLPQQLPLWIVFPVLAASVLLTHISLFRLPWFWDEAGYYIPAALDFFRTGSLIPHSTLTNAHPPLPSILLTGWWHIAGTGIAGTRIFLALIAAAALTAVFRLARQLTGEPVAIATTLLTAFYPVWFAQSTMAHADLFAAAFTLWALALYFQPKPASPVLIAMLFSFAVLSKETAIMTPVVLAAFTLSRRSRRSLTLSAALAFPVLPLIAWYAYHWHATGFVFGNPEFLRYNATANLSATRVLISFWHRIIHLTVHMNLFVPVVCALACLPMPHRAGTEAAIIPTASLRSIALILAANAVAFSILGGALLTRYLLPLYPLVLLLSVATWYQRFPRWTALAALSGVAFLAALFVNPPYSIAPEDNLTYVDFITLHQRAASILSHDFPQATVLTAWPGTAELRSPDLGYVKTPIANVAIDNFAPDQIEKAAQTPEAYDTAFVFSTKWIPPSALSLTRQTERTDTRYFDFHRDLSPAEIAVILHGQIVWQARSHGEWAAILRFPRANQAHLGSY